MGRHVTSETIKLSQFNHLSMIMVCYHIIFNMQKKCRIFHQFLLPPLGGHRFTLLLLRVKWIACAFFWTPPLTWALTIIPPPPLHLPRDIEITMTMTNMMGRAVRELAGLCPVEVPTITIWSRCPYPVSAAAAAGKYSEGASAIGIPSHVRTCHGLT